MRGVRLPLAEHPRAAGADGRRVGRARLRPRRAAASAASAGFVAGLVLAMTPITVAISRHNNPDALLVLCCVAALWFVVRALEDGRTRWLVLSGVARRARLRDEDGRGADGRARRSRRVAVGRAARPAARRSRQLLAGGAAMVVGRLAWPLLVLAHARGRPALGLRHERQQHLVADLRLQRPRPARRPGRRPAGVGGGRAGRRRAAAASSAADRPAPAAQRGLGGQAGWLLGFALVGGVAILVATRLRRADARTGWLIAVGGAFATTAVAFSYAKGIFHPYYVSLLAPFTAALVGAGAGELRSGDRVARDPRPARGRRRRR